MLAEKTQECRHEAGHAVARIVIGDTLVRIYINPNPRDRSDERGHTDYKLRERECRCGGYVRNYNASPLDTRSNINVKPGCPCCLDYCKNLIAARVAGGLASGGFMPDDTGSEDTQGDREDIEKDFALFRLPAATRPIIEDGAFLRATGLVMKERVAIEALTEALVRNDGFLDGPEATRIVRKCLSGDTSYLNL
jgi:hypothetical protein